MTPLEKLNELEAKLRERDTLIAQLRRQLEVKEKHGIEAHEIKSIALFPRGYATTNVTGEMLRDFFQRKRQHEEGTRQLPLLYGSRVTMKSGEVRSFPDANLKAELDGPDWKAP
jgi:hypothetical protein